jgi:NUMOD4 motif
VCAPGEERWLPVPRFEGWYEASCCGRIYSLARPGTPGGLLDPQVNSAGYRFVRLSKYGRVTTATVGSVVLATFNGPPPRPGARARHGDGGPLDDSLPNLSWG